MFTPLPGVHTPCPLGRRMLRDKRPRKVMPLEFLVVDEFDDRIGHRQKSTRVEALQQLG